MQRSLLHTGLLKEMNESVVCQFECVPNPAILTQSSKTLSAFQNTDYLSNEKLSLVEGSGHHQEDLNTSCENTCNRGCGLTEATSYVLQNHSEIQDRLQKAQLQASQFRHDFIRLNAERTHEQKQMAQLIEQLREQLRLLLDENGEEKLNEYDSFLGPSNYKLGHLENCVNQLLDANVNQEKMMCEMSDRLRLSEAELSALNRSIVCAREVLTDFRKNDQNCLESAKPLDSPVTVVNELCSCFKMLGEKLRLEQDNMRDAEKRLSDKESQHEKEMRDLCNQHATELSNVRSTFQQQMLQTVQRSEAATSEARRFTLEATESKCKVERELAIKLDELRDLRRQIGENCHPNVLTDEGTQAAFHFSTAKLEQEAARLRCERNNAISQHSVLTAKLEAAEAHIHELDTRSVQQLTMQRLLKRQLSEIQKQRMEFQEQIRSLWTNIQKLQTVIQRKLNLPVGEDDNETTLWSFKNPDVKSLIDQLIRLTDRVQESMHNEDPFRSAREQTNLLQDSNGNISSLDTEKRKLENYRRTIDEQKADLESVRSERDYYLQILNEKTEELSSVKADLQRQLKETSKLTRTKARLDELTQQIQLLKSMPAKPVVTCCGFADDVTPVKSNRCGASETNQVTHIARQCQLPQQASRVDKNSHSKRIHSVNETVSASIQSSVLEENNRGKLVSTCLEPKTSWTTVARKSNQRATLGSHPLVQLRQRLAQLEQQMVTAVDEKTHLRTRNNQLTDLLERLTEQNQRLIKELEERTNSSWTNTNDEAGLTLLPKNTSSHIMSSVGTIDYPRDATCIIKTRSDGQLDKKSNPDMSVSGIANQGMSSAENSPPVHFFHGERPSSVVNRNEGQSDDNGKQLTCTADCANLPDQPGTMHQKLLRTVFPIPDENIKLASTKPDLRTVSPSSAYTYSSCGNFRDRLHFDYRKLRSSLVNHSDQRTTTITIQPCTSPGPTQTLGSNDSRSTTVSAPLSLNGKISQLSE
ncbi:hypothetical protein EG68_03485 [Paragonimus skrjabini miyazakii]|uniref:Uncharacterized protein n=1 Tax=Paragonimus skrjabini miyazakii TaxID=59628 RepID=A0A8S9Z0S3_9TREM|nr:hypothetical protein EG68_03485 [Paragonimus skrjabini miyazakii]